MPDVPRVRLGEVASVRSGFAFKSHDWAKEGVPVVKIANVKDGHLDMDSCSFVSQNVAEHGLEFQLKECDILISMTGYVGQVATVRASNLPALLNQRVGRFSITNKTRLEQRYLYFCVANRTFREKVEALGYGSAQPNVSPTAIHGIEISLPILPEQHAIVSVLGALDDKIDLNRRMNDTLEAMTRAIFKDWFVDYGPTLGKSQGRVPYLTSKLWDLFPDALDQEDKPEGWKTKTLADVADSPRRGVSPTDVDEDTPYIGLEHMPRRSIALDNWEGAGKVTSNKSVFKKGEFLFGKLRPYFHKVGIAPVDGICSTDIVVIAPRTSDLAAFTLAYLFSDEFVDYTNQTSTGTKMPRTSWKTMGKYKICLPPEQITRAFQSLVQPLIEGVNGNIHESRTLAKTRDFLTPKLMSGEIRLREAEKVVETVA